jgi:3'-phosphoadenosine 5'-phosphosulfate sulfotransferase (PAPS reductase)/FAD synthetase
MWLPNLSYFDVILVNSSAGKDSQAMLDYVVGLARLAGILDRVVVVHCDLGRVEWMGTRDLAEEQARHYGVRFEAVSRPQGDLLAHVEQRKLWPGPKSRYCTAQHKRGQVHTLLTRLTNGVRASGVKRPARILNCLGMRAGESVGRAKLVAFEPDKLATNGRRQVTRWLPIHSWTEAEVWARIKASGVRHHPAYDLGMPRLSCCFCIFAPRAALLLAGEHNPELLAEYVRVEKAIGHKFKNDLTLESVQDALAKGERAKGVASWSM